MWNLAFTFTLLPAAPKSDFHACATLATMYLLVSPEEGSHVVVGK
jgi:hypothetical protein